MLRSTNMIRLSIISIVACLVFLFVATTISSHECIHSRIEKILEDEDKKLARKGLSRPLAHYVTPWTRDAEAQSSSSSSSSREAHILGLGPIRFTVRYADCYDASKYCTSAGGTAPDMLTADRLQCDAENVLTDAKRAVLMNKLVPAAIKKFTKVLSLPQMTGNLVVPSVFTGNDPDPEANQDKLVANNWTVPSSDSTTGIPDTDFVLYTSCAPTPENAIAYAAPIFSIAGGRPVAGFMNVNPMFLFYNESDPFELRKNFEFSVVMHEITHALGFVGYKFLKSRQPVFRRFKLVYQIQSPKVLQIAREYFNCPSLTGVELEDAGGNGTRLHHLDSRLLFDDFMVGAGGGRMKFSKITLAVFEDAGVGYVANYSNAESMAWGNHSPPLLPATGCSFIEQLASPTSPQYMPKGTAKVSYWCGYKNNSMCSIDRKAIGFCNVIDYTKIPPNFVRNFPTNPSLGGDHYLVDYAGYVTPNSSFTCEDPAHITTALDVRYGFGYGTNSRCINTVSLVEIGKSYHSTDVDRPLGSQRCIHVRCIFFGGEAPRVQLRIRTSHWFDCPKNGMYGAIQVPASAGYAGIIECPSVAEICSEDLYYFPGNSPRVPSYQAVVVGSVVGLFIILLLVLLLVFVLTRDDSVSSSAKRTEIAGAIDAGAIDDSSHETLANELKKITTVVEDQQQKIEKLEQKLEKRRLVNKKKKPSSNNNVSESVPVSSSSAAAASSSITTITNETVDQTVVPEVQVGEKEEQKEQEQDKEDEEEEKEQEQEQEEEKQQEQEEEIEQDEDASAQATTSI